MLFDNSMRTDAISGIPNLKIIFRNRFDADIKFEGSEIIVDSFFDVDFVGREFEVIFMNTGTETLYVRISAIHIYAQRRADNSQVYFQ